MATTGPLVPGIVSGMPAPFELLGDDCRRGKPYFWFGDDGAPGQHTHVAFAVDSRAKVDAFHAAALAAGGRDNGAPGLRPHYHPDYYGAFVLDPDGHNIEAVCHLPEAAA